MLSCVTCCLFPVLAISGTLDDFEQDSTHPSSAQPLYDAECQDSECTGNNSFLDFIFDDLFGEVFSDFINFIIVEGSKTTLAKSADYQRSPGVNIRKPGSPLLPLVRADLGYQSVSSTVTGNDVRIEIGKALFGAQVRLTQYREQSPTDSLDLRHFHGLYRLSYGNAVGLNFGVGFSELRGNERNTSLSMTLPFYWHFHQHVGFEYKPVFMSFNGTSVTDWDVSLLFSYQATSLVIGYRSVSNPVSSLSGYYSGFSYHF